MKRLIFISIILLICVTSNKIFSNEPPGSDQISEDKSFVTFLRSIEKCLIKADQKCLISMSSVDDGFAFARLGRELGDEYDCEAKDSKEEFTPTEVFACLFKPKGKLLLKDFKTILKRKPELSQAHNNVNYPKTYRTYGDLFKVDYRKQKGSWRIVGFHRI